MVLKDVSCMLYYDSRDSKRFFFPCRMMNGDERYNLTRTKGLRDMEKGGLMEISDIEQKSGEYGDYGLARYTTTLRSGVRMSGTLRLTENAQKSADMVAPCVMLYSGMKAGRQGKAFHDVHVVRAPSTDPELMKQFADGLRSMSPTALIGYMSTMSLDKFEAGDVIIFKDVKKRKLRKDGDDVVTVSFEVGCGETFKSGTVIMPLRLETELRKAGSGVAIYDGKKTSQAGRVYHDVHVLDETSLDMM